MLAIATGDPVNLGSCSCSSCGVVTVASVAPSSLWPNPATVAESISLAALRAPVDAFFADVMVNAEARDLRLNRLGLLKSLHLAMNRVADLSKLAT